MTDLPPMKTLLDRAADGPLSAADAEAAFETLMTGAAPRAPRRSRAC